MKQVQKFAVAMLVMVAVGCGGGGNGSSTTAGAGNSAPTLEAIVKVLPTNLMHPSMWTAAQLLDPTTPGLQADLINPTVFGIQDPTNIQANEQMVFQVVSYTPTGKRLILPNATFVSSDSTQTYGTLASNTGDYLAGGTATTAALAVTGTVNGVGYSAFYDIKPDQVRLLGNVLNASTNGTDLSGTLLQFFNSNGALVDTVTVASNGTFRASVPTVATSFTVVADTIPGAFYQAFTYLGMQYEAGQVTCFAPLPSGLTAGTTSLAGVVGIVPRSSGPLGPSLGCSDGGGKVHISKKG